MIKSLACTLLSLSLVLPSQSPRQSTEEDWVVRGTIAVPAEYVSTVDIDGYCYGFTDDNNYLSTYFVIPAGASQTSFEFHIPANPQTRYDFMLEIFPDCGLVKTGMNFGENNTFSLVPHYFYFQDPITDLGTYTLLPAQYLTGVIQMPEAGMIHNNSIYGFVRATKPDRSYSAQSMFTIYADPNQSVESTTFSIAVPDDGPYNLSVYLGYIDGCNVYTDELYLNADGLCLESTDALSFSTSDNPTITLRRGYNIKGMVTLPSSIPNPCTIDVFAVDDDGNGNSLTIYSLNPGESAPFSISFFEPLETLRFGYRIYGNAGQLISDQPVYTNGVTFSLNRTDLPSLDITNPNLYIDFTPVEVIP